MSGEPGLEPPPGVDSAHKRCQVGGRPVSCGGAGRGTLEFVVAVVSPGAGVVDVSFGSTAFVARSCSGSPSVTVSEDAFLAGRSRR